MLDIVKCRNCIFKFYPCNKKLLCASPKTGRNITFFNTVLGRGFSPGGRGGRGGRGGTPRGGRGGMRIDAGNSGGTGANKKTSFGDD